MKVYVTKMNTFASDPALQLLIAFMQILWNDIAHRMVHKNIIAHKLCQFAIKLNCNIKSIVLYGNITQLIGTVFRYIYI